MSDEVAHHALEGRDTDRPGEAAGEFSKLTFAVDEVGVDPLGGLDHETPRSSQDSPVTGAVHEGDAEFPFQGGELLGHCGRGQVEGSCRFGDAAGSSERPQDE